jgi:CBS domain-containing protein
MKLLEHLLSAKRHRLISIGPDDTVFQALTLMAQHDIGALLVMEDGKPVGIFSERDFARKGIQPGMEAKATPVRKMMSEKLICVTLTETVEDCMAIMTDRHIRHLPVLAEDGTVAGFLSIGDLVKETISEQTFIIGQLEHYISH